MESTRCQQSQKLHHINSRCPLLQRLRLVKVDECELEKEPCSNVHQHGSHDSSPNLAALGTQYDNGDSAGNGVTAAVAVTVAINENR